MMFILLLPKKLFSIMIIFYFTLTFTLLYLNFESKKKSNWSTFTGKMIVLDYYKVAWHSLEKRLLKYNK